MKLTESNYHSPEANQKYMSTSQFKSFMECEARTMAELRGEYIRSPTPSMLVGSYVDAYFSGTLDQFRLNHPEIFNRDGTLKAAYQQAEQIIRRIEQDELFMKYMAGQQQVIKTGKIAGIPFKIKIDSLHVKKAIVDLKIMRDFKPIYVAEQGRLTFIEAWKYDLQGAIYQAVEGHKLPFIIAAATKEKEPDISLIEVSQNYLDTALEIVTREAPRFQAIKTGKIEPVRCEKCDWCRRTKKLTRLIQLDELADMEIGSREEFDQ